MHHQLPEFKQFPQCIGVAVVNLLLVLLVLFVDGVVEVGNSQPTLVFTIIILVVAIIMSIVVIGKVCSIDVRYVPQGDGVHGVEQLPILAHRCHWLAGAGCGGVCWCVFLREHSRDLHVVDQLIDYA